MGDTETARGSNMPAKGGTRSHGPWGVLLALGLLVTLSTLSGCGTPGSPIHDQASFQDTVANDRKQLFDGRLDYRSRLATPVGEPRTFRIVLTALSDEASHRSRSARPHMETRSFQVGGVESASLTSTSPDVRIEPIAEARGKQVIARPGDRADWWWSVSASEPGDYDLFLVLTTYQEDSDRALYTLTPPITVRLRVDETWSHRVDSLLNTILAWGGAAVALTALLAFRAPLVAFVRTRRNARQERIRDSNRDGYL
ncbi:hypothetical protein OG762_39795 [Streptomyces sp. NBC_01136]|uniref:hypothetical protein n=1 Tax=unclassified Streptomyces TaxID=2593676 RepID=UPI0032463D0D|nr:hypothetical protein OG762_39795 [Streptomyces sp. NBC_01136]